MSNSTQETRIRKEITSMTAEERRQYIKTIKTASTDPRYKQRYEDLITIHKDQFDEGIHTEPQFLPWHRWYVLQYENLLREVDSSFTVAYWDWASVAATAFDTTTPNSLWYTGDSGFGGDGRPEDRCVDTGPFRVGEWSLVQSAGGGCLKRGFNGIPPNWQRLSVLLSTTVPNSKEFANDLRMEFHNPVHVNIGGIVGTMSSKDSASAPEFFLHHVFIDKIWEDWQKKSPAHRKAYFSEMTTELKGSGGSLAHDYLDNAALPGGVRVEYAEHGTPELQETIRAMKAMSVEKLMQIPIRVQPSPLSQAAIDLFHISGREVWKIMEEERKFQTTMRFHKANEKPLTGIDKQLGFDHNVLKISAASSKKHTATDMKHARSKIN